MAEVHIIGQIIKTEKFPKQNLFCKWSIVSGDNWKLIEGKNIGQTQVDSSEYTDSSNWSYPIDVHYATKGIQGWPKIYVQIFHVDWLGRVHLFGYGFLNLPTKGGLHKLECFTWKPVGNLRQRFVEYFLGGGLQIKYPDLVYSSVERYKLRTETMGIVKFEFNVILRNFDKFGIEY